MTTELGHEGVSVKDDGAKNVESMVKSDTNQPALEQNII